MKKRILFIEEGLGIGGAEKSLLTILQNFDYEKYEVDLFLFNYRGEFMNLLPEQVNLLGLDNDFSVFDEHRKISPILFAKKFKFKKSINSLLYLFHAAYSNLILKKEYIGWEYIKNIFSPLNKEYDVAISFLERKTFYFNVDKVKSKKKIGFVHIDYHKIDYDYELDKKYFKDMNKIATVSEHCKEVLKEIFPEYKNKFLVIKNMVSDKLIRECAKVELDIKIDNDCTNIVTVGRLTYQKGMDNAVLVCKQLVKDGYNVKWYVVGTGDQREELEEMIKDNKLENNFVLLGAKLNPYKYMNFADIYVQPSRFEGYGITIAEAKILNKPIVASNIPEFQEQIINNRTGSLAENNDEMVKCIEKLIDSKELRDKYSSELNNLDSNISLEELRKLYSIIE